MKKQNKIVPGSAILRRKAEKLLKNKSFESGSHLNELEAVRLVHELQVHQIELELQNEELRRAKEEAEVVSQKYTELYDFAPSGFFTLSKEGMIVELNLRGANMLGKQRSFLINTIFTIFVSDDTKSVFNYFLQKIFFHKSKQSCELTLSLEDKLPVYVFIKGTISKNGEYCIINVFDISRRILAEKALRKSEELNRSIILQTAMDGFWQVNLQGKILEVNETYCRMSGYSQQELLSMKVSELEAFETDKDIAVHIKKVIQTGKERFETIHRRKDGSTFYVEISTQYRPEEGRFVSFIRDITDRKQNEADLIYHAGLVENITDAIISTDVNFRIKSWNKPAEKIYGWKAEETIGKMVSEIIPTEYTTDTSREEALKLLLANGIWQDEVIQKRKDKTSVNIQASVKLLKDKNGNAIGSVTVNRDITEMKKSQAKLSQREEQYRSFFIDNNAVILLIDPETAEIKNANPAACTFYGWSYSESRNKTLFDISLFSKEEIIGNLQKTKKEKNNHLILKHRLATGELRDVEVYSGPVQLGETILIYGIVNDITEQRKANELLIESENRYRSLFEQSNDAIFLLDLESGQYIDCNRLAEKLTGYTREEILNLKTGALLPPGHKKETASNIDLILSRNALRKETEIITKDGKIIPVEFNSSKVEINKRQCILSMLHDISDRKAAEEALKQSEERVRLKLQSILSPEGSIANLELNDIIDVPSIQQLMDNFYQLVQIPMAIIDLQGKVLVGVGWQDICTKFHRVHPLACRNCFESDVHLTKGITDGEFMLYKCKNNMWDMATPLIIGGEHKGNLYLGQFFFKNEPVDYEMFSKQAQQYDFDEQEYLDALHKVPLLGKHKLENAKSFFLNLARSISQLSYSNIKLAKAITQQKKVEDELREKDDFLNKAQEIAQLGSWSLELLKNELTWSDVMYRIFDIQPQEFNASYEGFLESVHPDDRDAVNTAYTNSILEGRDSYEIVHRIIGKNTGELRYVLEKCEHERDASGKIIRSFGMSQDITKQKQAEEALSENERLLRESQAVAHIGSYSADLIQKTWKATSSIYEIFGIDETYPHTMEGWIRCVHPDFRDELINNLFQKNKKNNIFEKEYKIIRVSDGAERWVHGLGRFEYDNQMNPVRLIGTIQDITKRKQAEETLNKLNHELDDRVKVRTSELFNTNIALQKAEEKYRTIADYNYDWEYWRDQNGIMLYCSPSCERITGYKPSEFIQNSKLYVDIIHPDDLENYLDHHQKKNFIEKGNEINYRIIKSDGTIRWIGHVCQTVYNESGKILGIRGSNRDITERKDIEDQLKISHKKYELLSENISDGIFICIDGRFEYINDALCQIFGYNNIELDGMKLTQLVLPEHQIELENFITLNTSVNRSRNFEVECLRKDNSVIYIEMQLNYVANQNSIYGVIHDITERKQLQKNIVNAIIRTEEKERAYFSKELHDGLGPLLSTIRLYLQWSERPKIHKSWKEIIFKAEDLLEEALITVREISNKLSPHLLANYGLTVAVQRFIEKIQETCETKIIFESNINRRFDMEIESALYRAVIECINNTIKYAGAKTITIGIDETNGQLLLQYRDDGIGFDVEETLTLQKGLGLFNLQNRIQNIGGKIDLFSKPGHGVEYRMYVTI